MDSSELPPPPVPPADSPPPAGGSGSHGDNGDRKIKGPRVHTTAAATVEPTAGDIDTFLSSRINLTNDAKIAFDGLSPLAKEGLYILSRRGISGKQLETFLKNPELDAAGGANGILRLVTLLYDRGIEGFDEGFKPTERDQKFYSADRSRVFSLYAEYWQALWIASKTDARSVKLSGRLAVDWSELSVKELHYVERCILPHLDDDLKKAFTHQTSVDVDALAYPKEGPPRIVEVKTSLADKFMPDEKQTAKLRLQAVRHALVVRKNNLSGVEYVIEAALVSGNALAAIEETLTVMGVPHLIRIEGEEKRNSIQRGLTYQVAEGEISESRTRSLPYLPKVEEEDPAFEADVIVEKETRLPWTLAMKDFLQQFIPERSLKLSRLTESSFIKRMQNELRPAQQIELIRNLRSFVEANDELKGEKAERILELTSFFASRIKGRLSVESIRTLLKIAAIATGERLEREDTLEESGDSDQVQSLVVNKGAIEGQLRTIWNVMAEEWKTLNELAQPGRGELEYFASDIPLFNPDEQKVYIGSRRQLRSLREIVAQMCSTVGVIDWDSSLLERFQTFLGEYDVLSTSIEVAILATSTAPAMPIEFVYKPLPHEVIDTLSSLVLMTGPLPPTGKRKFKAPGIKHTKEIEFSEEAVTKIYKTLVLLRSEGDDTVYYYPNDLQGIEYNVKYYLRQVGWSNDKILAELPKFTETALKQLGGSSGVVKSLSEVIPTNFVRSDLVNANDRVSGAKLDVTDIVSSIWNSFPQKELTPYIRVYVAGTNRRKIYFVNWSALEMAYPRETVKRPTFDEFEDIIASPDHFQKYLEFVNDGMGDKKIENWQNKTLLLVVDVHKRKNGSIKIYTPKLYEYTDGMEGTINRLLSRFVIFFREGIPIIKRIHGYGSRKIAMSWFNGRGHKIDGGIENLSLIETWMLNGETKNVVRPSWAEFLSYLKNTERDPIARLVEIRASVDDKFTSRPETVVLTGGKTYWENLSDCVTDLVVLTPEEAAIKQNASRHNFWITAKLHEGRYIVTSAKGNRALDIALACLEGRGHKITDPLETAFIADSLGASLRSADNVVSVKWDEFLVQAASKSTDIFRRFATLRSLVDPTFDPVSKKLYFRCDKTWQKDSRIYYSAGLKILTSAELDTDKRRIDTIQLSLELHDGRYYIDNARGTGAIETARAYLEGRGIDFSNKLPTILIYSYWGREKKRNNVNSETPTSWEDLKKHLFEKSFDQVAVIIEKFRECVAFNFGNGSSGFEILGTKRYEKKYSKAVSLDLELRPVTTKATDGHEEQRSVPAGHFCLTFSLIDGNYRVVELSGMGSIELGLFYLLGLGHQITDATEIKVLSAAWGATHQRSDEDERLTVDRFADYLSQEGIDPIARLLEMRHLANPSFSTEHNDVTLVGQRWENSGKYLVSSLRLLTQLEYEEYKKKAGKFFLRYRRDKGNKFTLIDHHGQYSKVIVSSLQGSGSE